MSLGGNDQMVLASLCAVAFVCDTVEQLLVLCGQVQERRQTMEYQTEDLPELLHAHCDLSDLANANCSIHLHLVAARILP